MIVSVWGGLCVTACVYVCDCVCVCVHRGVEVRTFFCEAMGPRLKSSPLPRGVSFRQWPTSWQLWPLGFF